MGVEDANTRRSFPRQVVNISGAEQRQQRSSCCHRSNDDYNKPESPEPPWCALRHFFCRLIMSTTVETKKECTITKWSCFICSPCPSLLEGRKIVNFQLCHFSKGVENQLRDNHIYTTWLTDMLYTIWLRNKFFIRFGGLENFAQQGHRLWEAVYLNWCQQVAWQFQIPIRFPGVKQRL
jgi:hypothetical protein